MKYLLDTHVLLWWYDDDKRLTETQRSAISDPKNDVLLSAVNAWEMSLKIRKNKLKTKRPLRTYFERSNFQILSISMSHILELHKLPNVHKDPFDRILIAQARAEECVLITSDEMLHAYHVPILN